jgi:hypothetical protein
MHISRLLRTVAATAAVVVAGGALAATPALAAKPAKTPIVLTSSVTASPTTTRSATFTWTGATGATYQCSLDGATNSSCTSPLTVNALSDGQHTFTVRSKPPRPVSARKTWVVDTTGPAKPVITQLPSPTRTTSTNVYFTDTDASAVSHTCALDGAAAAPCTSPFPVSGLSDAVHTVYVTAKDALGNAGAPADMTWTVDSQAPISVVVDVPALTKETFVDVSFSADSAVSFSCSVDNGPFSDCVSPLQLTGLAEGQHSITVVAADAAGNASLPGTGVWTVDRTPPTTPTFMTGPAANTDQADVDFVLGNVDSSGTLKCSLDSAPPADCPSPLHFTGTAMGPHRLDVYSVDAAGNQSVATATWQWTRAAVVSPAQITDGPASPSNVATPDFIFGPTGSAAAYWCSLDGQPAIDCDSGPWPFAAPLTGDGPHVFSVKAEDPATGTQSDPATWTWVADFTAPQAPVFSTAPAASTTDTTAVFSFPQESGVSYTCSLDGAAGAACASPVTLPGLGVGGHSFAVVAKDAAGNTSQTTHGWTVVAPTQPTDPGTPTPPVDPGTPTQPTSPVVNPPATKSATSVTITPSSALRGQSSLRFATDVRGISASTVLLRQTGTTADRAVALSCANAAGAAVDCAAGPVRTVFVQPRAALVAGQSYTLSTTAGVIDTTLKPAAPSSKSFRASTDEQENSLGARATWRKSAASSAYGKRYLSENRKAASVRYAFRGTKVSWYTMTAPSQGRATVYVDGVKKARVNNYSARTEWHVVRTVKGLRKGAHTLSIVVAGRKGSKAGTGTGVVVDAVRVGSKLVTNPKLAATWGTVRATGASAGGYAVSATAKATSSFTFRGTSVSWVTATAATMGKAKVYVDGVLKAKVDNYSAKARWNVRRSVSGLADTVHTVKVKVLGKKRAKATAANVVVDRWLVG